MTAARLLLLKLPADSLAPIEWRRIADGVVIDQGDDLTTAPLPVENQPDDERVIAITPAADVTINWAELPGFAPAQAQAAARLLASENSISALDSLHVAVGRDEDDSDDRLIAVTDRVRMDEWLARTQSLGFDPDAILPASLLLSRPDSGFVRAEIWGEAVVRSRDSAFADEAGLVELIVGDAPLARLEPGVAEAGMLAVLDDMPVNLRQGAYARTRRWRLDWTLIRRLALLGAAIAGVAILISLVLIAKYSFAADALELKTQNLAETAVPGSDSAAIAALDERLAAQRGGGAGFGNTAAAIFAAVRAVPGVELTLFDFGADGSTRITLAAGNPADIATFQHRLEGYGFVGTAGTVQQTAGRHIMEMTVKLP